jgi:hypothetical protein
MKKQKIDFSGNWGLDRIDQIDLPLDGLYKYSLEGENIDIAIVDSGISEIDDIRGRVFHISDFRTYLNFTHPLYIDPTSSQFGKDYIGHGTHVSSIAAGKEFGVAKKAKLYSFKIYHLTLQEMNFSLTENVLNDLVNWHNAKTTPTIVLLNLISRNFNLAIESKLQMLNSTNRCIIITPAGNFSENANLYYPSNSTRTISVGSINESDHISSSNALISPVGNRGSNFNADIFSPGENILAGWIGNSVKRNTSTTCAAAFVTGIAALYAEERVSSSLPVTTGDFRIYLDTFSTRGRIRNLPFSDSSNRILFSKFQNFTGNMTTSGTIVYFSEGSAINFNLRGFLRFGNTQTQNLTYSVSNTGNSLPPNLHLLPNGTIVGVVEKITSGDPFYVSVSSSSGNIIGYTERNVVISASSQGIDFFTTLVIRVLDYNNPPFWNHSNNFVNLYVSSMNYNDVVNFSFANLVTDPENDNLTFSLQNGNLPAGLILSSNGVLKGRLSAFPISSSSLFFVSVGNVSRNHDFVIRVTDGFHYVDASFSAVVTRTSANNSSPIFLVSSYPDNLLDVAIGQYVSFHIPAMDADGDELIYRVVVSSVSAFVSADVKVGLPSSLTVTRDGFLQGLVNIDTSTKEYAFRIEIFDGYNVTNDIFKINVVEISDLFESSTTLGWLSEEKLGQIDETYPCLSKLEAFDFEGAEIFYTIASGSVLPPGIFLNSETGYLIGKLNYISADTNYSFFARVHLKSNPGIFLEKKFVLSAKNIVDNPISEFSLLFSFQGNDREELLFTAINSSLPLYLNRNLRFRKNYDINFPIKPKKEILLARGTIIPSDDVVLSALGFDTNTVSNGFKSVWREMEFILGDVKKAVARNSKGEICYEVVYIEIIDENVENRKFTSSAKAIVNTSISGFSVIVPTSLKNLRKDLEIDIGYEREVLPLWMISGQTSANGVPLGYVPSFVLMYLKPNRNNNLILEEIKNVRKNILPYGTKIKTRGLIYRKYFDMNDPEEFLIHFPLF